MKRNHSKYILLSVALVVVAWLAGSASKNAPNLHRQSTTYSTSSTPTGCDPTLWQHVYHPKRLHVISSCSTVTGTVEFSKDEADGDTHIRLKLDKQFSSFLNSKNYTDQDGDLVLEPVCEGAITQADAVNACQGYHSSVSIPTAGTHVKVIGAYVLDMDHGWNEIHPVTSITAD